MGAGGAATGTGGMAAGTGGAATGTGGMGGDGSGTGGLGGSGGSMTTCGDGIVDNGEACDDGNMDIDDGCTNCLIEAGWECDASMPTQCTEIQPVVETDTLGGGPADDIVDGIYDGSLASMKCIDLTVTSSYLNTQYVTVEVGINHDYLGDLVIKVQSPNNTITTLMSAPGINEPADNGNLGGTGDSSDLKAGSPILFDDDSVNDAELMGAGFNQDADICEDVGPCDYFPNPGAGPGVNGLADFNNMDPNGLWRVCVGDAYPGDEGAFKSATISVLAW